MNEALRGALRLLDRKAYEVVQRANIENAPAIDELMRREEVAKHPIYMKIKGVVLEGIQKYEDHLHYNADTHESLAADVAASNALLDVLLYFETAEHRRLKIMEDTADTTEMGPSEAE